MNALRDAFEEIVADVPVYGDLDRAIEQADGERRQRVTLVVGLTAAAAVLAVIAGALATHRGGDATPDPAVPTPTRTPTDATDPVRPIPSGQSDVLAVEQVGPARLVVGGRTVPGRWGVDESRLDVWVGKRTDADDYESQWWGKGTTVHKMPPSIGSVLRGGVAISQDAHWIAWTRPKSDVYGMDPPMVMEVVDTTTATVRWSRDASADSQDMGALAVTNDGVVVFARCLEIVRDAIGWAHCTEALPQVWAPKTGVTRTLPAGLVPADWKAGGPTLLIQATGAHNGLLVQASPSRRATYVRLSRRGDVETVAALPSATLAVTADERFALVQGPCGQERCRWTVVSLKNGARRSIDPPGLAGDAEISHLLSYVVERDDLLLVRWSGDAGSPAALRCSLARARCVRIEK